MPIISKFCLAHPYLAKYEIARHDFQNGNWEVQLAPKAHSCHNKKYLKPVEKRSKGHPAVTVSELCFARRHCRIRDQIVEMME